MKIIFDTSVWIEYFRNNPAYYETCNAIIDEDMAYTLEIVFGELLQGAKGKNEIEGITNLYEILPEIKIDNFFIKGGNLSRGDKLFSKGIGLIDASIIAATIETNAVLWTLDGKILKCLDSKFIFRKETI